MKSEVTQALRTIIDDEIRRLNLTQLSPMEQQELRHAIEAVVVFRLGASDVLSKIASDTLNDILARHNAKRWFDIQRCAQRCALEVAKVALKVALS